MLIECTVKRLGGSKIDIENVVYEFLPNKDGAHVCDVKNQDHIQRFLSIREGYKLPGAKQPEPEAVVDTVEVIGEQVTEDAFDDDDDPPAANEGPDIGKMQTAELTRFAKDTFDAKLEAKLGVRELRRQIRGLQARSNEKAGK